jgi:2-C-methyl-D-erythritol 2,4-cyclodiphosphate synthase
MKPLSSPRPDHFTDETRAVLGRAAEIVQERGSRLIGPEHILFAIVEETWCAARRLIQSVGANVEAIHRTLDVALRAKAKRTGGTVSIGPGADQVLRVAVSESRRYGTGFVGTEHVLLGLLSIRDGLACAVLEDAGVHLEQIREYARTRHLPRPTPAPSPPVPAPIEPSRPRHLAPRASVPPTEAPEVRAAAFRVGIGYDVHELETGGRLVLGGVTIPSDMGLVGHSDADVLCHAIMDALLGAAGMGDIGQLFPDTDPAYEGASSIELLREVVARIRREGWVCSNVDSVVVAQEPRIAPHVPEIKALLGVALQVDPHAVGVKGTTTEGLGFEGEGLGIAAHAVAIIVER